jgi:hypothetical protein
MTRFTILLALCLTVGCKKEENAAPPTSTQTPPQAKPQQPTAAATMAAAPSESDCDKLGARTVEISMAETPAGTPPDRVAKLKAISEEAGHAIASLCKTDGWSAEAVACGLAAKDPSRECNDKLTDVQQKKMQAAVMAIFSKAAPP